MLLDDMTTAAAAAASESGVFEGYASLFDVEDTGRDIVLPGAFRDTLRARGAAGVKLLYQHDAGQPIGVWQSISEDARGLKVRGRLMLEVARAREVWALMRGGALDGLSIGFRAVKGRREARSGLRRLAAVDLWEISLVTFPMQPGARVTRLLPASYPRPLTSSAETRGSTAADLSPQARLARIIAQATRLVTEATTL